MTHGDICIIGDGAGNTCRKNRRLFEVSYVYQVGEYSYLETSYCRGSVEALEAFVRRELRAAINADEEETPGDEPKLIWTFEHQEATAEGAALSTFAGYLGITARELGSPEDISIIDLETFDGFSLISPLPLEDPSMI